MTCRDESIRSRLDDHADGVLSPARAAEVERHLAQCADCRAESEALAALLASAAALPPAREPSRDLWPGIAARLTGGPEATAPAPAAPSPRRARAGVHPAWAWSGWAAAAGLALLLAARGPAGNGPAVADAPTATSPESAVFAALRDWEAGSRQAQDEYAQAAGARETTVASPDDDIAASLGTIDLAIAELRAALTENPDNATLARMLGSAYAERIALLRQATRLTSTL